MRSLYRISKRLIPLTISLANLCIYCSTPQNKTIVILASICFQEQYIFRFDTQWPFPMTNPDFSNSLCTNSNSKRAMYVESGRKFQPTDAGAESGQCILGSNRLQPVTVGVNFPIWRIINLSVSQQEFQNRPAFGISGFLKGMTVSCFPLQYHFLRLSNSVTSFCIHISRCKPPTNSSFGEPFI